MRSLRPGWKRPYIAAFGGQLRRLRQEAGLSQRGLGERAGLTREHVAKLERGLQVPRRVTLERLAGGLGVDLAELVAPRYRGAEAENGE